MDLEFSGEVWPWQGPAAWHFVSVPAEKCAALAAAVPGGGWGTVPVVARIGGTEWRTSVFPHDGCYVLPVKAAVRRAEDVEAGDTVTVRLAVDRERVRG